jgi:hypothetical protein
MDGVVNVMDMKADGTMEGMNGVAAIMVEDGVTGERVSVPICLIQPGVVAWSTLSRRSLTEVHHLP